MKARLALAVLAALAAAAAPFAAPSRATNTSEDARLRVTLFDGAVHEGQVKLTREKLEVKARRRVKLRYRDIASLADPPPPGDAERAAAAAEYARRAAAASDVGAWVRLGQWAGEQGLAAEARAAFERAVGLDPEHTLARKGLGQVKADDGAWVDAAPLVRERERAVAAGDLDGLLDVARFALQSGLEDHGFRLVARVLQKDTYHQDAIDLSRRFTAAYVHSAALSLPVRGRWQASPDSTRHHQKKGWAVYALDLYRVDGEGKERRGAGDRLEDWLAWDQPFYAVAAGRVVEVRDGNPDNPARKIPDGAAEKHNGVSIDHGNGELSWYVHAKAGSIVVKEGDVVERGQLLGHVGNSGASAVPHLHFTLVAFGNLSVPWACEDYTLIAPDGTPIAVTRACPREGWTFESKP